MRPIISLKKKIRLTPVRKYYKQIIRYSEQTNINLNEIIHLQNSHNRGLYGVYLALLEVSNQPRSLRGLNVFSMTTRIETIPRFF